MALFDEFPNFQGGFIWDFADQGLCARAEKESGFVSCAASERSGGSEAANLLYGGDFGDVPNDGAFCCNGLFDAFRRPHPGAYEVAWWYRGKSHCATAEKLRAAARSAGRGGCAAPASRV